MKGSWLVLLRNCASHTYGKVTCTHVANVIHALLTFTRPS